MCQLVHSTRRIALGVPSEIDVLKPWPTISLRSGDYVCRQLECGTACFRTISEKIQLERDPAKRWSRASVLSVSKREKGSIENNFLVYSDAAGFRGRRATPTCASKAGWEVAVHVEPVDVPRVTSFAIAFDLAIPAKDNRVPPRPIAAMQMAYSRKRCGAAVYYHSDAYAAFRRRGPGARSDRMTAAASGPPPNGRRAAS
jgi:hypothetical protein